MLQFIRQKLLLGHTLRQHRKAQSAQACEPSGPNLLPDLGQNLAAFRAVFQDASDIVIREFQFGVERKVRAALIFVDGMIDRKTINDSILRPLMYDSHCLGPKELGATRDIDILQQTMVSVGEVKRATTIDAVVQGCLSGDTVLLLDGAPAALLVSTRGWESRGVTEPKTEVVVRGPREGFTETLRSNTSLLRRKIHSPDLRIESMQLGRRTKTDICIAYVQGIVNPQVVEEVKRRLQRIQIDAVLESGYIEGLIEDAPFSPFSTIANSEKPDVVAAKMLEGRVAILVDGTPFVLTVPMLFVESFQVAEDYYSRPYYTSIVRMLRFGAFLTSIFVPALYVAVTTFRQEEIPATLLVTLAAAKQGTPFPAVVEILVMGVFFELLREAGVRLPRPVGSAISIVGALVIGQSAVEAGLIGTPVVVVVALTAIASFAVPSQADVGAIARVLLILLAASLGTYGMMLGALVGLFHLASLRSFGTPYLSPLAPMKLRDLKDVFVRAPIWALQTRPSDLGAQNSRRQGSGQMPVPPASHEQGRQRE